MEIDTNVPLQPFISCGSYHSVALTLNGLYMWGFNGYGELGLDHNNNQNTPQKMTSLDPSDVISVACGWNHSIAHTKNGLYVWGFNQHGQLGLGHNDHQYTPQKLTSIDASDIISVVCGGNHSMVLTKNGLFVWGNNTFGELGLGNNENQNTPQKLTSIDASDIISVACSSHSIAHTKNGLYVWGNNAHGELGLGHYNHQNTPQKLTLFDGGDIISVACGGYHSIALTKNGLFVWGYNLYGQLGLGDIPLGNENSQTTPLKLTLIDGNDIISVVCGWSHSIALTKSGLFVWGNNSDFQLGLGNNDDNQNTPQKLTSIDVSDIISVACGWNHSIALTKNGLFGWGYNGSGQLGLGHHNNHGTFQKVPL